MAAQVVRKTTLCDRVHQDGDTGDKVCRLRLHLVENHDRVLSKWGPVRKICGALPRLNTQLSDRLRTQSCPHRHVSIPVLPQAGKSLIYFETNFSAVFWNHEHCGNLAG